MCVLDITRFGDGQLTSGAGERQAERTWYFTFDYGSSFNNISSGCKCNNSTPSRSASHITLTTKSNKIIHHSGRHEGRRGLRYPVLRCSRTVVYDVGIREAVYMAVWRRGGRDGAHVSTESSEPEGKGEKCEYLSFRIPLLVLRLLTGDGLDSE
jgi:hypothetical protein